MKLIELLNIMSPQIGIEIVDNYDRILYEGKVKDFECNSILANYIVIYIDTDVTIVVEVYNAEQTN